MPPNVLRSQQERKKTNLIKFEAVNVLVKLWSAYVTRLRSLALIQGKIVVC